MNKDYPMTPEEFDAVYSKVPRLTVDIVVRNSEGQVFLTRRYLTKRAVEPCNGQWHLPGGTVYFGESLMQAVQRITQRELGIKVVEAQSKGCIEYPSHYKNGMDQPVGLVFEVAQYEGIVTPDEEADGYGWYGSLPEPMHADQDEYLVREGYLTR